MPCTSANKVIACLDDEQLLDAGLPHVSHPRRVEQSSSFVDNAQRTFLAVWEHARTPRYLPSCRSRNWRGRLRGSVASSRGLVFDTAILEVEDLFDGSRVAGSTWCNERDQGIGGETLRAVTLPLAEHKDGSLDLESRAGHLERRGVTV